MSHQVNIMQNLTVREGASSSAQSVLEKYSEVLSCSALGVGDTFPRLAWSQDDDYESLLQQLAPFLKDRSYLCWIDCQDNFEVVMGYVMHGEVYHAWDEKLIQPYLDRLLAMKLEDAPLVVAGEGQDPRDEITVGQALSMLEDL